MGLKTHDRVQIEDCSVVFRAYDVGWSRCKPIHAPMTNSPARELERGEGPSAPELLLQHSGAVFESFFERSVDAVWLLDPQAGVFVDCNQAAVELSGAENKQQLLRMRPEDLSPPFQSDGTSSAEKSAEIVGIIQRRKTHLFEWLMRRQDGRDVPVEVSATALFMGGKNIHVIISRDISERKKAERELFELNQSLERRVTERTAALSTSEARLRAMVEHAPEAIVVFDGNTGRFLFGNEHACRLYGVPMEGLTSLTPADVSPEFQPMGRRSSELARELMDQALAGGMPIFEWTHQQQPNGRLIPTEVRLLRLPAEGQNLLRASIIDNTERKRAERALRESEANFRALFEGSNHGVVLHDENELLQVNSAAVRLFGCQGPQELLGNHPGALAPLLQPNGKKSTVMAAKYIEECMTQGGVRFEWLARAPNGKEIPMEVALTRIEWSGRQVIQAYITDITERQRAQAALAESEARFSAAFQASPISIAIARMSDERFVLVNDAFVNWAGYPREEILGRTTAGLGVWERLEDRATFWADLRRTGSIRDRECRFRNRFGKLFTILLSSKVIQLNGVPHLLSMSVDITERKQAEAELRASEARLRESEARFSVAFQASPLFIGILRMSDGAYVLANDAFVNWLGYPREEVIGRTSADFGMWGNREERDWALNTVRMVGSIRQKECRWLNRRGEPVTVLLSAETIKLNNTPHILSFALDITERKQAEAELQAGDARLRESEARFSAAFQASPAFLGILRMSDEKYVLANDAYLNWLGYPLEEVLGRTCVELGLWENPAERDLVLKDMHTFGSIRQRECRWKNRHGERFTILLSAETIQLNDTLHMLSMAMDITQRKRAEEELLKTLEREKELSQLKSNFVSMVSHEFRTPLGIIQSSAELLRDFHKKMQPGEREEQLESIARNTRRMAGMMEGVLVLSRLDAGKLDFQPATLDLNLFCRRLVDEVLSATNRRCLIELSLSSVPPEAEADERLLGHVFTNLLSNAVKYSEPGATVRFAVEGDGHDAVCVVRDQGIGISADDQQQLFKAFHRGGNVGSRPGTGLGLLLVKRCAELHGGTVQVNSRIGEGTTVIVRLPVFERSYEKDIGH
jgi:PAS domain S-box-containing protein